MPLCQVWCYKSKIKLLFKSHGFIFHKEHNSWSFQIHEKEHVNTVLLNNPYVNVEKLDNRKNAIFLAKEKHEKLFDSQRKMRLFPYQNYNHLSKVKTWGLLLVWAGKEYPFVHWVQPHCWITMNYTMNYKAGILSALLELSSPHCRVP